jgi:hypothetical protein
MASYTLLYLPNRSIRDARAPQIRFSTVLRLRIQFDVLQLLSGNGPINGSVFIPIASAMAQVDRQILVGDANGSSPGTDTVMG